MVKLNTNEKWEIGVALGLVGLLLLLAYFNGASVPGGSTPLGSPQITNPPTLPTLPGYPITVQNNVTNPTYTLPGGQSCSCGCNNQQAYGTLDALVASYTQTLNAIENGYIAATIASLPKYALQFLNDGSAAQAGLLEAQTQQGL